MSRIDFNIIATFNSAQVESQIARLKVQLASLNAMSAAGITPAAIQSVGTYANALGGALTRSGMFEKKMVNLTSQTERFGRSLERGNLRLGQYFREGYRQLSRQEGMVRKLAREQIRLQNSVVTSMGDGRAAVYTPRGIDQAIDKQRILNQEHRIFRQVVAGGSTQLINWGKNTQWAGRQLMVGLTLPLMIFGGVAAKVFLDADKQLTRLAKVYGDASKGMVDDKQLEDIRQKTLALAQDISSAMGVATTETLGIAADIAATGKEGNDLLAATRESMRLSVLGDVDRQEAMRATLAIQNVFKKDTDGLTESINFLNLVENQTSTSLNDLVTGIVKAGPVVEGLGGDIKELALMMVAMREGGITASEAANAIKSSLASLINPTKQTRDLLNGFGIDLVQIVDNNAGDVIGTLVALQEELAGLDQLSRQRSIEQIFGKFQFARINALLSNLGRAGSQTAQVFDIAEMSVSSLATAADRELGVLTESASTRFKRALESIKANLIPIGSFFAEIGTILLNFANNVIQAFNSLPDFVKNFLGGMAVFTALVGPVIMITGVLGNFFGYLLKGVATLLMFRKAARGAFEYYTPESIAAKNATDLLTNGMFNQVTATNALRSALDALNLELSQMALNMRNVGSASAGAAASASAMQARTAASALVAGVSPSVTGFLAAGGKNISKGRVTSFKGPEFSHLTPASSLASELRGVQTVGTLVAGGSMAAMYQRKMNTAFAPTQFYDPSQGSRAQVLTRMAQDSGRGAAARFVPRMSAAEMERLLPTRQQYDAYVAQYNAQLRQLLDLGPKKLKELSAVIGTKVKAGDIAGAEAALMSAINQNKAAFNRYYQEELMAMQGLTGNLRSVVTAAGARSLGLERRMESLAPRSGFVASGGADSLFRLISASSGGGLVAEQGTKALSKGQQAYQAALTKASAATDKAAINSERLSIAKEREQYASQRISQITTDIGNVQAQTRVVYKNYQRVIQEDGTVVWENSRIGKQLVLGKSKLANDLEYLHGLYVSLQGAVRKKTLSTSLIARLEAKEAALSEAAAKAGTDLAVAEQILAKETKKLIGTRIGQIISGSADFLGGTAERRKVGAALSKLSAEILEEISMVNVVTTKQGQVAVALDQNSKLLAAHNLSTGKLLTAQQIAALGLNQMDLTRKREVMTRETLLAQLQAEAADKRISRFAMARFTRYINNLSNETLETITSLNLMQNGIRNFTLNLERAGQQALVKTSSIMGERMGKAAMGASMAAGMGMMFMPQGEGAGSKIGGGALMGASMGGMVGMMFGPMGAAVGLFGGAILGSAIPAITAFAEAQHQLNIAAIDYAQALGGSAKIINAFSKQAGKLTPSEALTAAIGKVSAPEETLSVGKEILETDAGKELLDLAKSLQGDDLVNVLKSQLQQLTLLEIFTPDQAKKLAQTIAVEIGKPIIGEALIDGIESVIDSEGNFIGDSLSKVFQSILPELDLGILPQLDENGNRPQLNVAMDKRQLISDVGEVSSYLDRLRDVQALVTKDFMEGKISLEEYSERMLGLRDDSETVMESLLLLKSYPGWDAEVTDTLLGIAERNNLRDEFKNAENAAKDLMGTLEVLGGEADAFYTSIQVAAAYGDISESEIRTLVEMTEDPKKKMYLTTIFETEGATENAVELIKILNSGVEPEFMQKIIVSAESTGIAINDLYSSLVGLIALPSEIQKSVIADIQDSPEKLSLFLENYQYVMSLPNDEKELRAEVFGNKELKLFQENWKKFLDLDDEERKKAIFEYSVTGTYEFPEMTAPVPTAVTELQMPSIGDLFSQGPGGGGSTDTSYIDEKYDALIEKQDAIIEKIKEEREERQRLLDKEKEALDFALREQDLKNKIAKAKAEGRMADAALLQSQLDAERKNRRQDQAEARRQEEEDRRIKAAEDKKKSLEEQKDAEKEAAGGGSSGGSSGMSEEDKKIIETRMQFLNDELQSVLLDNVALLDNIALRGAAEFFDSEPVKRYREEMSMLGVPLEVVNTYLDDIYDQLVNKGFGDQGIRQFDKLKTNLEKVGISGETLLDVLPNVFGIVSNANLTKDEIVSQLIILFQDVGMSIEEAEERAKEFFKISGSEIKTKEIENFKGKLEEVTDYLSDSQVQLAAETYADGLSRGLTKPEILGEISRAIFDSVFTEGIEKGTNPTEAANRAAAMSAAVKDSVLTNFQGFEVEIPVKTEKPNYSSLPDWMKKLLSGSAGSGAGQIPAAALNVNMDIVTRLAYGESKAKPLWVTLTTASGAATGGYVSGPGTSTSDSIPTLLSNGEYVIKASSVDKYGIPFLHMVNMGMLPRMAQGGYSRYPGIVKMAMGGQVGKNYSGSASAQTYSNEYNINVNVAGTNASAEEIADTVINTLKRRERMSGAVTRV